MATSKGNSSANTLNGTSSADYIYGYDGNDILNGNGGNDHLYGGNGADKLDGGLGVDWLYGEGGNDTIYFGGYGDHYDGGTGTDTLSFAKKTPGWTLNEITNHDIENAGGSLANIEKVLGSNYADTIQMNVGTIDGAGGNDQLYGGDGTNNLNGGSGTDYLYGNAGNDYLDGGSGIDWLYGGTGNDVLYFGGFNEHYDGGSGTDTLSFQKWAAGVSFGQTSSIDENTFGDAGGSLAVEKVVGSQYADRISMDDAVIDGGGGNDILSEWGGGSGKIYGGAGTTSPGTDRRVPAVSRFTEGRETTPCTWRT
jgi:Ca2+-binding RTX toxin-like protein